MSKQKKRFGDRKDGYLVRDADTMHKFMPYIMPNRADAEAMVTELIDMTPVIQYIKNKNYEGIDFKYTFFHVICAAVAKTIALRPKLNRFYAGRRLYQRNNISLSFTVKKQFTDHSEEGLAIVKPDCESNESPVEQIYKKVKKICTKLKKENQNDGATDIMDKLLVLPRPIVKMVVGILEWLDYHGWYPTSFMNDDPYYSSVFLSNLGSIKMRANYHHLTNWGTNSVFVIVGEKKLTPYHDEKGNVEMRDALELGLTLDERIADGYYYSKSVRLLKALLADPSLLDQPIMHVDDSIKDLV